MNDYESRPNAVSIQMKQQLHDCVAAFEALLWQTLKGHLTDAADDLPAASAPVHLPAPAVEDPARDTIRRNEPPNTEFSF